MASYIQIRKINLVAILTLLSVSFIFAQNNRTINGIFNNLENPTWGSAGSNVIIRTTLAYADSISTPAGPARPNPRVISNEIFAQHSEANDPLGLSAYTWAWGQFIDHDITFSPDNPDERFDIAVPVLDAYFDPFGSGDVVIPMHRSAYDISTGTDPDNPRVHINAISAFIDASTVYGSDVQRASWLRTYQHGKLRTSQGNLLPFNTMSGEFSDQIDPNAPVMAMPFPFVKRYFVAGDVRANENSFLTSIHTIFVREHNRLCDNLRAENPGWSDEKLYQRARKIVGALIEAIVYQEWLPALGIEVDHYQGYHSSVQPGIMNIFSTAAYRYGHTTIGDTLVRMNDDGACVEEGNISLKDAFFNPAAIQSVGGIEPYLIGMATVIEQDFDCQVVDVLRNFLFGEPGEGGLDLVSLNINRGRDRGLADYNTIRSYFGLEQLSSFDELSANEQMNQQLKDVYGSIDQLDPWVGMLAENHMDAALFGQTAMTIIKQQFMSLRDGDRFYYEVDADFSPDQVEEIKNTLLSEIIRRNTGIHLMQDSVFIAHEIITSIATATPEQIDFTLYPNPATENIHIAFESIAQQNRFCHLDIFDMYGRHIQSNEFTIDGDKAILTIDLNQSMTAGVYTIQVRCGTSATSHKIIKLAP